MKSEFSVIIFHKGADKPQPLLIKSDKEIEEAYMSNNIKNQALYLNGTMVFLINNFPCYKDYKNSPATACSIGFYNVTFLAYSIDHICKN